MGGARPTRRSVEHKRAGHVRTLQDRIVERSSGLDVRRCPARSPEQNQEGGLVMQLITISGNLGKDAELRRTQNGDAVCSFSVGVKNGFGRDAGSNWYRVNVWGKRGTWMWELDYFK